MICVIWTELTTLDWLVVKLQYDEGFDKLDDDFKMINDNRVDYPTTWFELMQPFEHLQLKIQCKR